MNKRVEMNENMLEQVNGGDVLDKFFRIVKMVDDLVTKDTPRKKLSNETYVDGLHIVTNEFK